MAFPPLFTHFFGIVLQSICFGIYCVIFTLYLRIQLNRPERWKGLLLYALALNFILCTAYFIIEIVHVQFFIDIVVLGGDPFLWGSSAWLNVSADALYIAIDFISQAILFYRCWVMWRQLWVLVVPAIISIAFLVVSLMTIGVLIKAPGFNTEDGPQVPDWFLDAVVSFFTLSLVVNALLTGLIVYKILSVYRDIRGFKSPFVLGQGPNNLSPLISILIESGMITFITQLIQTIMYKINPEAFQLVAGSVVMLYGISTTVVLVRVEMGSSTSKLRTAHSSRAIQFAPFASTHQTTIIDVPEGGQTDSHSGSEMKLMRHV